MIRWHATEESAIIVAVNDEALSRLHQRRPASVALHLRGVESLARGLTASRGSSRRLRQTSSCRTWTGFVWPPPQTPLVLLAVKGMEAAVDHAGDNWWQRRDGRQR
jgi:hypothetical protein